MTSARFLFSCLFCSWSPSLCWAKAGWIQIERIRALGLRWSPVPHSRVTLSTSASISAQKIATRAVCITNRRFPPVTMFSQCPSISPFPPFFMRLCDPVKYLIFFPEPFLPAKQYVFLFPRKKLQFVAVIFFACFRSPLLYSKSKFFRTPVTGCFELPETWNVDWHVQGLLFLMRFYLLKVSVCSRASMLGIVMLQFL